MFRYCNLLYNYTLLKLARLVPAEVPAGRQSFQAGGVYYFTSESRDNIYNNHVDAVGDIQRVSKQRILDYIQANN